MASQVEITNNSQRQVQFNNFKETLAQVRHFLNCSKLKPIDHFQYIGMLIIHKSTTIGQRLKTSQYLTVILQLNNEKEVVRMTQHIAFLQVIAEQCQCKNVCLQAQNQHVRSSQKSGRKYLSTPPLLFFSLCTTACCSLFGVPICSS